MFSCRSWIGVERGEANVNKAMTTSVVIASMIIVVTNIVRGHIPVNNDDTSCALSKIIYPKSLLKLAGCSAPNPNGDFKGATGHPARYTANSRNYVRRP
ncbi:hypothetical protein EVAR_4663_1 [Eumeta japonica]|uniref:Uncharacterized protein n=1 Tax=Eumeta variegata TaxID=151549 RepID=A0A4C1YDQ9_EUMVA|nr:hypothetical protein EVAR_4663_1 [Eumeta japonica]